MQSVRGRAFRIPLTCAGGWEEQGEQTKQVGYKGMMRSKGSFGRTTTIDFTAIDQASADSCDSRAISSYA
jgi:hypothetical protein